MPREGYKLITVDDDSAFEMDIIAKAEKCKSRPEVVRLLLRDWRNRNSNKGATKSAEIVPP